ncbi:MAG: sugar phosphate isomerase/epimerase [Planctomycetales bacterium]|nr:sugar phosphate isomerase/epimerase [Planctomycetales bacterium]
MQLGFMTAILPDSNLKEVFQTASDIGYECIEVMCWPVGKSTRRYAGITHIDVNSLDDAAIESIKLMQQESGVAISGLGYYPNALSPNPEESEQAVNQIRAVIQAADRLGIRTMNTFVGRDWTKNIDDNWPRFLDTWKPIIQLAEQHNVRVGIENCPMFFTNDEWPGGKNLAHSPAIWERMFNDIPSDHFGLNYDPSHMVFQHMDYLAPMIEFADKIFHVHAKDLRVDRARLNRVGVLANPNLWHTPKLPGMGEVNWGQFFGALTDGGYRGAVCVEVEDRAYEGSQANCVRALQQSYNYLRNFVV